MQFIGSVTFTIFLFLWTFFYAIFFVTACLFLPFRLRFALARLWGAVLLKALKAQKKDDEAARFKKLLQD